MRAFTITNSNPEAVRDDPGPWPGEFVIQVADVGKAGMATELKTLIAPRED